MARATDSTGELLGWAFETLTRIYRPGYLNVKFGKDAVRFGAVNPAGSWQTKFMKRFRCYTTRLCDVLRVA